MTEQEEKLISAAQEFIFAARLGGYDLVQFGREAAQILYNHGPLKFSRERYN